MRSQKFVARKNKFNQDARATPSFLSFASVSRLKSAGSSKSCVTPDYRSTSNAAFGVCHERQRCSHHSAQGWSEWTGEELPWVLVQTKYATLTGLYRFSTNTRRSPIASANTGLNDSIPLGLSGERWREMWVKTSLKAAAHRQPGCTAVCPAALQKSWESWEKERTHGDAFDGGNRGTDLTAARP